MRTFFTGNAPSTSSGGGGGSGDVVGPAVAVDNTAARYDGTTGKLLQGSALVISDVTSGGIQLSVDDGATAQLDMNFNAKGASSRFNWWINGSKLMDFTDIGGGKFALRNQSGQVRAESGILDSNFSSWNGDVSVGRLAAGILGIGTSTNNHDGWHQWAGESRLAANATNATATLAATGLLVTVQAGRKYGFKAILFVSDSTAAEGVKIDFGAGTATASDFRAHVTGFDTALAVNSQVTSLTASAGAGTFTGSGMIEVHGSFEPAGAGTFGPRYAQNTHVVGTLTLFQGSHLLVWDIP